MFFSSNPQILCASGAFNTEIMAKIPIYERKSSLEWKQNISHHYDVTRSHEDPIPLNFHQAVRSLHRIHYSSHSSNDMPMSEQEFFDNVIHLLFHDVDLAGKSLLRQHFVNTTLYMEIFH